METIRFIGVFDQYTPVNSEPHYVFQAENTYLIKCEDYPALISNLSPGDLINIEGDVSEQCTDGIKLVNAKFGGLNE